MSTTISSKQMKRLVGVIQAAAVSNWGPLTSRTYLGLDPRWYATVFHFGGIAEVERRGKKRRYEVKQ